MKLNHFKKVQSNYHGKQIQIQSELDDLQKTEKH